MNPLPAPATSGSTQDVPDSSWKTWLLNKSLTVVQSVAQTSVVQSVAQRAEQYVVTNFSSRLQSSRFVKIAAETFINNKPISFSGRYFQAQQRFKISLPASIAKRLKKYANVQGNPTPASNTPPWKRLVELLKTIKTENSDFYTAISPVRPIPEASPLPNLPPDLAPHPPEVQILPTNPSSLQYAPCQDPQPSVVIEDPFSVTNKKLKMFSASVSQYAKLFALLGWACDPKQKSVPELVSELIQDLKPGGVNPDGTTAAPKTIWEAFYAKHGATLGRKEYLWCCLVYFFVETLGLVDKVIGAYLEATLELIRSYLNHDSQKQADLFKQLKEEAKKYLVAYIGANKSYHSDITGTKPLKSYIEEALNLKPLSDDFFEKLGGEIAKIFLNKLAPKIQFRFFQESINSIIRWLLDKILPRVFPPLLKVGTESTGPSDLRRVTIDALQNFVGNFKADKIAEAALPSLQELLNSVLKGDSSESSNSDLPNQASLLSAPESQIPSEFTNMLKHLFEALEWAQLGENPQRLGGVVPPASPKTGMISTKIHKKIDSWIMGDFANELLPLVLSTDFEPLFANLLTSVNELITRPPQNVNAMAAINAETQMKEAEGALKGSILSLFENVKRQLTKELLDGIEINTSQQNAEEAFQAVLIESKRVFWQIDALGEQIETLSRNPNLHETLNLYPHLLAIKEALSRLPSDERLKTLLSRVNDAEREVVSASITPIYKKAAAISAKLVSLVTAQKELILNQSGKSNFILIQQELENLNNRRGNSTSLDAIERIKDQVTQFAEKQRGSLAATLLQTEFVPNLASAAITLYETCTKERELIELEKELHAFALFSKTPYSLVEAQLRRWNKANHLTKIERHAKAAGVWDFIQNRVQALGASETSQDFFSIWSPLMGLSDSDAAVSENQNEWNLVHWQSHYKAQILDQSNKLTQQLIRVQTAMQTLSVGAEAAMVSNRSNLQTNASELRTFLTNAKTEIDQITCLPFLDHISRDELRSFLQEDFSGIVESIPLLGRPVAIALGSNLQKLKNLIENDNSSEEDFKAFKKELFESLKLSLTGPIPNQGINQARTAVTQRIKGIFGVGATAGALGATVGAIVAGPVGFFLGGAVGGSSGAGLGGLGTHAALALSETAPIDQIGDIPEIIDLTVQKIQRAVAEEIGLLQGKALAAAQLGNSLSRFVLSKIC